MFSSMLVPLVHAVWRLCGVVHGPAAKQRSEGRSTQVIEMSMSKRRSTLTQQKASKHVSQQQSSQGRQHTYIHICIYMFCAYAYASSCSSYGDSMLRRDSVQQVLRFGVTGCHACFSAAGCAVSCTADVTGVRDAARQRPKLWLKEGVRQCQRTGGCRSSYLLV